MAKKANAPNPFTGRWRIVSTSAWDQEFIDDEDGDDSEFVAKKKRGTDPKSKKPKK